MKLGEIVEKLGLQVQTGAAALHGEVKGGYVSDLMSDVMAHAEEGDIWITLQTHQNIVAVALMKSLAGVILVNSRRPQEDTAGKAETEGICIMVSPLPAFELAGRLYQLGIRGRSVS